MRQCSIRVSNILRFHHPIRSKTLQFLQVLIAPLFVPIFVLSRGGDDGNTRKKKEKGRRGTEESEGRRKIFFTTNSSPFILATSLASTSSPPFQWRVAPFYWHACWLTFSLSLSLFFEFFPLYYTTLIVLRAWLQTSLSLAKNAISAMTFHRRKNEYRVTYLIMAGTITFTFFRVIFGGNFDGISFENE